MALLDLYLCLVQFIVTAVILDDGLDQRPQFWKQLWWFSPTLFKIGPVVSEENNSFKKFTTTDAKSIHDPFRSVEIFFSRYHIYKSWIYSPWWFFQQLYWCPKAIIASRKICHSDQVTTRGLLKDMFIFSENWSPSTWDFFILLMSDSNCFNCFSMPFRFFCTFSSETETKHKY